MEFGLAPRGACSQRAVRHVFTTADNRACFRRSAQFLAKDEGAVETPGELLLTLLLFLHRTRLRFAACSGVSGNLSLDERFFKSADAREFPNA